MKQNAMKHIQSLLMIVLAALSLYLYSDRRTAVESLNRKIAAFEAANKKEREDCETRVAYLKAEKERELAHKTLRYRGTPLLDLVKKLPTDPKKVRSDAIGEMSNTLKMDEKQEMQVRTVLADFDKAKVQVFEKSGTEKRFLFDPLTMERINEVRRDAMGKMAGILTKEQLIAMKEKNFDLQLGIREMAMPKGKIR